MIQIAVLRTAILLCVAGILFAACGEETNPLEDQQEPAKPSNLQAELLPDGIQLTWKPVSGAETYELFRSPGNEDRPLQVVSATSFVDRHVEEDTPYTYWVRGIAPAIETNGKVWPGLIGPDSERRSITYASPQLLWCDKKTCTSEAVQIDFGQEGTEFRATLKNRGGGTIQWSIQPSEPWLSFVPQQGECGASEVPIVVRVDRRHPSLSCQSGTYRAQTTIMGNLGHPLKLEITMQIAEDPVLAVEPGEREMKPGDTAQLKVLNTGTGNIEWEILGGEEWLEVEPRSGTVAACDSEPVQLRALEREMPSGSYPVALHVQGSGQQRSVAIRVQVPDIDMLISPTQVLLREPNWKGDVTLINRGEGKVDWEAIVTRSWLSAGKSAGQLASGDTTTLTVTGRSEDLDAGTHTAQVRFLFQGGPQEERLTVELERIGTLQGDCRNILTAVPVPGVSLITDVGRGITDSVGHFSIRYQQEGLFRWKTEHADYLPRQGSLITTKAFGDIGEISLIPVPRRAGEIAPLVSYDTPWMLALSADEKRLLIVNRDGGFLSIADTETRRGISEIPLGQEPHGIAVIENRAFVANWFDNSVSVVDLDRLDAETFDLPGRPAYLAAYGGMLYVTLQDNISGNQVAEIDAESTRVVRYLRVGRLPSGIAADPDGRAIYVANHDDDLLSIVDLGSGVAQNVPVGARPLGCAVSPGGDSVYTANAGSISRVDAAGAVEVERLSIPDSRLAGIVVAGLPDGTDLVYATDTAQNRVWMWHPASGEHRAIDVGFGPFGLVATRDGLRVFVAEMDANGVGEFMGE